MPHASEIIPLRGFLVLLPINEGDILSAVLNNHKREKSSILRLLYSVQLPNSCHPLGCKFDHHKIDRSMFLHNLNKRWYILNIYYLMFVCPGCRRQTAV